MVGDYVKKHAIKEGRQPDHVDKEKQNCTERKETTPTDKDTVHKDLPRTQMEAEQPKKATPDSVKQEKERAQAIAGREAATPVTQPSQPEPAQHSQATKNTLSAHAAPFAPRGGSSGNLGYHPDMPVIKTLHYEGPFSPAYGYTKSAGVSFQTPMKSAQEAEPSMAQTPTYWTPQQSYANAEVCSLAKVVVEQCSASRLPPPEPSKFSGDPMQYNLWRRALDLMVENKGLTSRDKLYYLQRYVTGAAEECVDGFSREESEASYTEALHRLETRFGDSFHIAKGYKKKLREWPKIAKNDAKALQKFADYLKQCESVKKRNTSMRILDEAEMNSEMLLKLPEGLVRSWSRDVYNYKRATMTFPPFEEFVRFVEKEASMATDPVIEEALKSTSQRFEKKVKEHVQSFATEAAIEIEKTPVEGSPSKEGMSPGDKPAFPKRPCFNCKSYDHYLNDCPNYLEKTLEDRKKYAESNQLCFACLNQRHIAKNCKHRKRCKTCNKLHPTALHDPSWKRESEKEHVSLISSNSERGKRCTMIVPVFISHKDRTGEEVLIYALLDTQSDATFVTANVCRQLGEEGVPTHLRLSTLSAKRKALSCNKVTGLQVRGFNSSTHVPIHAAFTQEAIPTNREDIPTAEVVNDRFPHLQELADQLMPKSNSEVGLLIGNDHPAAFKPKEFLTATDQDAFGWRTELGWGIMGVSDCPA